MSEKSAFLSVSEVEHLLQLLSFECKCQLVQLCQLSYVTGSIGQCVSHRFLQLGFILVKMATFLPRSFGLAETVIRNNGKKVISNRSHVF